MNQKSNCDKVIGQKNSFQFADFFTNHKQIKILWFTQNVNL